MNGFLRHLLSYRSEADLLDIALGFKQIVGYQQSIIDNLESDIETQQLEHARCHRDMLAAFLVALDKPEDEDELRDTLHEALIDMSDEVARLEEHIST